MLIISGMKSKQASHKKLFRINILVEESPEQFAVQQKTTVYSTCMVHPQLEEQQHPCFPRYSVYWILTLLVVEPSVWEVLSQKGQHKTTSCDITSKVKVPHLQQDQSQNIFQQQQEAEAPENLLHSCNSSISYEVSNIYATIKIRQLK